jgi:hypothetical protein
MVVDILEKLKGRNAKPWRRRKFNLKTPKSGGTSTPLVTEVDRYRWERKLTLPKGRVN